MKKVFILALCMIKATIGSSINKQKMKEFSEIDFWINKETGQKPTFKFEFMPNDRLQVEEVPYEKSSCSTLCWYLNKTNTNEYTASQNPKCSSKDNEKLFISIELPKMHKICHDGRVFNFQTKNDPISAELKKKMENEEDMLKKLEYLNRNKGWNPIERPNWTIDVKRLTCGLVLEVCGNYNFLYPKDKEVHAEYEGCTQAGRKYIVNLKTFTLQVIENGNTMKNSPAVLESMQQYDIKQQEKETDLQKAQDITNSQSQKQNNPLQQNTIYEKEKDVAKKDDETEEQSIERKDGSNSIDEDEKTIFANSCFTISLTLTLGIMWFFVLLYIRNVYCLSRDERIEESEDSVEWDCYDEVEGEKIPDIEEGGDKPEASEDDVKAEKDSILFSESLNFSKDQESSDSLFD